MKCLRFAVIGGKYGVDFSQFFFVCLLLSGILCGIIYEEVVLYCFL